MNLKYCQNCKCFRFGYSSQVLHLYCNTYYIQKTHPSAINQYLGAIIRKKSFTATYTKSFIAPEFTLSSLCPYILEHTLSTEEEQKQSLDALELEFEGCKI